jgi:branched-subunit amino acid ABC-type transport system permease component
LPVLIVPAVGFGIATAAYVALAAVGFTLQAGVSNIFNFAYGDIMITAAFVAYAVNSVGGGLWELFVVAAVTGAVVSLALNRFIFRRFVRHGVNRFGMLIVTLWTGLILQNILLAVFGPRFFSLQVSSGRLFTFFGQRGILLTGVQLISIGIAVAAVLIVAIGLRYTRVGMAMRALATNPDLAQSSGVQARKILDYTWIVSGIFCGLGGVVLALATGAFEQATGEEFLVIIFAATVLGGVGRPVGAAVASLVLGIVMEVSALYIPPSLKELVAFALLIIVLITRPGGLFSLAKEGAEVAVV